MFPVLWTFLDACYALYLSLKFLVAMLLLGTQPLAGLHAESRNDQFYGVVETQPLYENKKGDLQFEVEGGESIHYKNGVWPAKKTTTVPLPRGKPPFVPSTVHFMDLAGPALKPSGYSGYCNRNPDKCGKRTAMTRVALTDERKRVLEQVNTLANSTITSKDDIVQYGVYEYWAIPEKYDGQYFGDCEDYVLTKKKLLMEAGFPRSSLSITIVDADGDRENDISHAVLTVHTEGGDLILDNLVPEIYFWSERYEYKFLSMQANTHTGWIEIHDPPRTGTIDQPVATKAPN